MITQPQHVESRGGREDVELERLVGEQRELAERKTKWASENTSSNQQEPTVTGISEGSQGQQATTMMARQR